jgi:hypothetical protein
VRERFLGEIKQGFLVFFGDDQGVPGPKWVDVKNGEAKRILQDTFCRKLSGYDLAEDTVFHE